MAEGLWLMADGRWSRLSNRFHNDSRGFEAGADPGGELVGTGGVAVHADRVGFERDDRSIYRDDRVLLHHPDGARDDGGGVVDDRARFTARRQRSIGFVGTVREDFGCDAQSVRAAGVEDLRAGKPEK